MIKILHIIQVFVSQSGAALSMMATAKYSSCRGDLQQTIIPLQPPDPAAVEMAKKIGMGVSDRSAILRDMENADIVHLHFWNNPQMYEFLRSEFPAIRLLVTLHIGGYHPPQILTRALVDHADFVQATSPYTYEHPVFQNLPPDVRLRKTGMIYSTTDFERFSDLRPRPHNTFNVGYIGTVNFDKMHPNYVPMSAQINIPSIRFIVCGNGIQNYLQNQARQLGAAERFEFRGYVQDVKSVIETLDIFGYPLCKDNYSTVELVLQESMYAGVPPVIFPYGGAKRTVVDNYTGLIVHSELEYKQAIEYLYHHPEERIRLGNNAREYARQIFGGKNAARATNQVYDRLMSLPKRRREWGIPAASSLLDQPLSLQTLTGQSEKLSGAEAFIQSLGDTAPHFTVSMRSQNIQELFEADNQIASSSLLLSSSGSGGILHYRSYYPKDGYLRLWAGLVLQRQGRNSEAVSELTAAINLGCNHWRVAWYLAQTAEKVNNISLAKEALKGIMQVIPNFAEAQAMLERLEAISKA